MPSLNRVFLMGNLTRDPESRSMDNGTAMCKFGLAVNTIISKGKGGERKEEVSFFDIVCWGNQAEAVGKYLKKGFPVLVEGRLKQDTWQTEDGAKRSRVEVVAERVEFLPRAQKDEGQGRLAAQPEAEPF